MKYKKITTKLIFGIFLVLLFLARNSFAISSYTAIDEIDDITYLEDEVLIDQGDYTPYIDIVTIEINGTHAILELQAPANESEQVVYYIWIYWTDVVELETDNEGEGPEKGRKSIDDVNETLCYYKSSSMNHITTALYNSTGGNVYSFFDMQGASTGGNYIYFPIPTEAAGEYPNPKTVWAKTRASNHNGIVLEEGETKIDYIDFYPVNINTYLSGVKLGFLGFLVIPIVFIAQRKFKKR